MYVFKKDVSAASARDTTQLWSGNIEVSYEVKVDEVLSSDKRFINIGGPTNHFVDVENNSNGRNYTVVARFDRSGVGFKKETIHGAYDEYETRSGQVEKGSWHNIRYRQTVIEEDKKIKLEGWIDNESLGEFIDDGKMTKDTGKTSKVVKSNDKGALFHPMTNAKMVWTAGAYSGLYLRFTGTVKSYIKNLSVKEI
jgi:hypothetical protein